MTMAHMGDRTRHSKYLVETYTTPEQFPTRKEFIEALDAALSELTLAWGLEPPDLAEVRDTVWQS